MGFSIAGSARAPQNHGSRRRDTRRQAVLPIGFRRHFSRRSSGSCGPRPLHSSHGIARLNSSAICIASCWSSRASRRSLASNEPFSINMIPWCFRYCKWLEGQGVNFITNCTVTDIELKTEGDGTIVQGVVYVRGGVTETIAVAEGDLVFVQNGSMTDASSFGSMSQAPEVLTKADSGGWRLWEKLAAGRPEFGNPAAFNASIAESWWESSP